MPRKPASKPVNNLAPSQSQDIRGGKVKTNDLTIVKTYDKSTPMIGK